MESKESTAHRTGWWLAGLRMQLATGRLISASKAGFRPDQPRVPRGNPDGGKWTYEPGYARVHRVARRRAGGGHVRIGNRWHSITLAQEARLAQSTGAMRGALRDVRKLDPKWKPPPQAYSTVEGLISANRAEPGPFAREWVSAPSTNRRLARSEQQEVDRIGRKWGCHRCGTKEPGTRSSSFVGDHQVPKSMGKPTRIYPHCLRCSSSQGGLLSTYLFRVQK